MITYRKGEMVGRIVSYGADKELPLEGRNFVIELLIPTNVLPAVLRPRNFVNINGYNHTTETSPEFKISLIRR